MAIYALGSVAPRISDDAFVHPEAVIIGDVRIEAGASIWPCAVLRGDHGSILVGERSSVQDCAVIHSTEEWPTVVGSDSTVGHCAHLEGCFVEGNSLIGVNAVVLNRARVESHSVVAGSALVREDMVVPTHHIAKGVPAKIAPADPEQIARLLARSSEAYVQQALRYRAELRRIA